MRLIAAILIASTLAGCAGTSADRDFREKTAEVSIYGSREGETNTIGIRWIPRDPGLAK
jgi:hypothetical protein